jgi:hypothetical protein
VTGVSHLRDAAWLRDGEVARLLALLDRDRMTLLSGRVLFDDSLSSCASISSYFGTVVSSPFGTMCTTL